MFDEFIDSQDVAYSILKNSLLNDRLSHAYLIDSNGCSDSFKFVIGFAKAIICDFNYTNYSNCNGCNKCMRIDNNNFLEIRVINSDGLSIKKEDLLELQEEFSLSSIESKKRVYIIKDCDKMTLQAANSLLKFLEEPNSNIVALLVTDNFSNVISTIVSRCQIIRLKKNNDKFKDSSLYNFADLYSDGDIESFVTNDKYKNYIKVVIDFVSYYEDNGMDVIIYMKDMWHNYFKDRSDNIMGLNLLINVYYDVLKCKCGVDNLFFKDYGNYIKKFALSNDITDIVRKIDVCVDTKEMLKCNLNINLLMDNMVIDLGGDYSGCC